jgi:hypothetical protein
MVLPWRNCADRTLAVGLEIAGIDFQFLGGRFHHHRAGFARCHHHRVADAMGAA